MLLLSSAVLLAADPPSLESLVDKVLELRKTRSELERQEAAAISEIRTRLRGIEEKLANIDPPVPKPPEPKPPDPVPPNPADPLVAALRAAYAADSGGNKAEQVKLLAELYLQAGKLSADPAVTTTAALKNRIDGAAAALGLDGTAVFAVRRLIAEEIRKVLGNIDPPVALTSELRKSAEAVFIRIHLALKGVV